VFIDDYSKDEESNMRKKLRNQIAAALALTLMTGMGVAAAAENPLGLY